MTMNCHIFNNKTNAILLGGGRNNKLFLSENPNTQDSIIIKVFPPANHERYQREVLFLNQCRSLFISKVPVIIDICEKHLCVVMTKVPGSSISIFSKKNEEDIFNFIIEIQKISYFKKHPVLLPAVEGITTTANYETSINSRLDQVKDSTTHSPEEFSKQNILNKIKIYLKSQKYKTDTQLLHDLIQNTTTVLKTGRKFISPSDFGVHNCRQDGARLYFIDFEYSGFDSGINFIGDLMMQPDTEWESGNQFLLGMRILDELFGIQYMPTEPIERLFGIRWALIIIGRLEKSQSKQDQNQYTDKLLSYFAKLPLHNRL